MVREAYSCRFVRPYVRLSTTSWYLTLQLQKDIETL